MLCSQGNLAGKDLSTVTVFSPVKIITHSERLLKICIISSILPVFRSLLGVDLNQNIYAFVSPPDIARAGSSRAGGLRMSDADFADYDSKVTFMFPGQGAQYMGMAANICDEVSWICFTV